MNIKIKDPLKFKQIIQNGKYLRGKISLNILEDKIDELKPF